jgi:hypothetical protein
MAHAADEQDGLIDSSGWQGIGLVDNSKETLGLETIGLIQEPFSGFLSGLFAYSGSVPRALQLARLYASGWPADSERRAGREKALQLICEEPAWQ